MRVDRVLWAVLTIWTATAGAMPGAGQTATPAKAPKKINAFAVVKNAGGEVKAPLFAPDSADIVIAQVDTEVITLGQLAEVLAEAHEERGMKVTSSGKTDYQGPLDRLIAIRLVGLEAQDMGLLETSDVADLLKKFERGAARDLLKRRVAAQLKPDAIEVERQYKEETRQFKLSSLMFAQEANAKAFRDAVKAGGDFETLGKAAIADKKATGTTTSDWLPKESALPQVLQAVAHLPKGQLSDPVFVQSGFVVLRVDDIRYLDDPAAKARAEAASLERKRTASLEGYTASLVKKHAVIDTKLLDRLDFEAKGIPGFEALMKDERAIARMSDGAQVTVAELAKEIRSGFFHGLDGPIKEKKLNRKKDDSFKVLLQKAAYDAEVKAQKIKETDEFRRLYDEYRASVLFGAFLKTALLPGIEVKESEVKAYFEKHKKEFSYPAFYKLDSLAFTTRAAAQGAIDKLKKGTDFKWLRANADGQLPPEKREFEFDAKTLTSSGVTPGLAKLLDGAKKGDLRILEESGGFYVVIVREVTPPSPQPYTEAREKIANKLHGEKMNAALSEWVAKLRKAHDVKIFITQLTTT